MTYREFYTFIVNGTMNDAVKAFAQEALTALDTKAAKRKTSPSAVRAAQERDTFRASVASALTAKLQTSAQIAATVGETPAKVAAALTALVAAGIAIREEFKPTGKGRKVNGYRIAEPSDFPEEGAE